ncbi:MAG: hypothetical protein AAGF11_10705 [Myxococcota bacterium]
MGRPAHDRIEAQPPEPGVYVNRMSPSSHTRGHQGGVQFMREYLAYLEVHDRRVINGSRDEFCPTTETSRFALRRDFTADDPLVAHLVALMKDYQLDLAGIEFVEDRDGQRYVYDINGTTNYNGDVEATHGLSGMGALADLVAGHL